MDYDEDFKDEDYKQDDNAWNQVDVKEEQQAYDTMDKNELQDILDQAQQPHNNQDQENNKEANFPQEINKTI